MSPLALAVGGRRIALGVSGSIAAFKAPSIAGRLTAAGAEVDVILTAGAGSLVGPLTFQAMTHRPVVTGLWDPAGPMGMDHLEIAHRAAALLVAPATAHILAGLALGLADDALTTTALAFHGPMVLAPAMEPQMWRHPATEGHVATLAARGAVFVGPTAGRLASGAEGVGRMAEVDAVLAALANVLGRRELAGRALVITAGPTREPIDPVRYLANHSTGHMGYALAAEAARRGAHVTLISGPVSLTPPHGVHVMHVERAVEMRDAVLTLAPSADALIMAAAVADFRPAERSPVKLKKDAGLASVALVPNPDILADLALALQGAAHRPVRIGFAAETEEVVERGAAKLTAKGLDLVVANQVPSSFGDGPARAWLVGEQGAVDLGEQPKSTLAGLILDALADLLAVRGGETA